MESSLQDAFCDNVRRRRLRLKMTQLELAGKIGVQQPWVARLERGGRMPILSTIEKVAAALNTSAASLLKLPE